MLTRSGIFEAGCGLSVAAIPAYPDMVRLVLDWLPGRDRSTQTSGQLRSMVLSGAEAFELGDVIHRAASLCVKEAAK